MFRVCNLDVYPTICLTKVVLRASALATDCEVEVIADPEKSMKELRQNKALGMDLSFSLLITS